MMELNDIKDIWKRIDARKDRPEYSLDEIAAFRNARSRDFTSWIRTSLSIDLILKMMVLVVLTVITLLFRFQPIVLIFNLISILILAVLIPYEFRIRQKASSLDRLDGSIQELLSAKIDFLKGMYNRVQFIQGLTNPFIVISGLMVYCYFTYRLVPPLDFRDWMITAALVILSFILTLPSTLAAYGFQLRSLQGCLSSLTDPEGYENEARRFNRRRRFLTALLYGLLVVGISLLVLVLLS